MGSAAVKKMQKMLQFFTSALLWYENKRSPALSSNTFNSPHGMKKLLRIFYKTIWVGMFDFFFQKALKSTEFQAYEFESLSIMKGLKYLV